MITDEPHAADDASISSVSQSPSSPSSPDETTANKHEPTEPTEPTRVDADSVDPNAGSRKYEERLNELTSLVIHTRHELNNLLTGILGQAQLLLMREELSPSARRRIETMEDLARRLKEAVAKLNSV